MSENHFDNVWMLLRNIDFKTQNDISNKFLCTICKQLMINAQSGPCGCTYCLECIRKYLCGELKLCPGETDECKQVLLNFQKNIQVDHRMNMKTMKLIVKCPEESCEFTGQLKTIPDHMRTSDHRLICMRCPYGDIGCKEEELAIYKLGDHLQSEVFSHSNLLIQWINNLKKENSCLKEEIRDIKKMNNERQHEITKIENYDEDESRRVWIYDFQSKLQEKSAEIERLKDNSQRERNKLQKCQSDLAHANGKILALEKQFSGLNESMKKEIVKLNETKTVENFRGEFLWDTDKWYPALDGYKMRLQMLYNYHYSCVYVSACIMRCPYFNDLQWPFTHDVTIAIVYHTSGEIFRSHVGKFDINDEGRLKPTSEQNSLLWNDLKITVTDQFTELCQAKQLSIKCTLQNSNA